MRKTARLLESPRLAVALIFVFSAAHFIFLQGWLHFKIGDFYFFRGDDVARIAWAFNWLKAPYFMPTDDWLPLPTYLLGAVLAGHADPYFTPLFLSSLLTAGVLTVLGLIGLELFPDVPLLALLPMSLATRVPYFEFLGLSAGAEIDLWFFSLLSLWFWLLYLRTNKTAYCLLNAACLFLASMTRYEAWLYILAFLPIAGLSFKLKKRPVRLALGYFLICVSYIVFFVCYQELHRSPSPQEFQGLPLSYRGIRDYFHGPDGGMGRSFLVPLRGWFSRAPVLASMEVIGICHVFRKLPALRWYGVWAAVSLGALCLEAGIFGIPMESKRLVVFFHLLLLPLAGGFLWEAMRLKTPSWCLLAAPTAAFLFLSGVLPRPEDSTCAWMPGCRDSSILAKTVHDEESQTRLFSNVLVELRPGPGPIVWDFTPFEFAAFDRFRADRLMKFRPGRSGSFLDTRDNPSIFSLPRPQLERYLSENRIGWIAVSSLEARAAVRGLAREVATVGSRTLLNSGTFSTPSSYR